MIKPISQAQFTSFLLKPAKCTKNHSTKCLYVALSVLLGIVTIGILHGAFAIKNRITKKPVKTTPKVQNVSQTQLKVQNVRPTQVTPKPSELWNSLEQWKWRIQHFHTVTQGDLELGVERGYLDAPVFGTNRTLFILLCCWGDSTREKMAFLLKQKFDPTIQEKNHVGEKGNSGLMWAIANANNSTAMQVLDALGEGDYVNLPDYFKKIPLHLAIIKGYDKISAWNQPLEFSNLQIVEKLLECGSKIDVQDNKGNTPLHYACLRRDKKMIQALLTKSPDLTLKNSDGLTPKEMFNLNYEEACAILSKASYKAYLLDKAQFESQNINELTALLHSKPDDVA